MGQLGILDYTSRDYTSLRADLIARVQAKFPDFDVSAGNPDVAMLEALAEIGDRLAYLENRSVNEAFLARARLRQSVIDHVALIDYQLSTAQPAQANVLFTLTRAYPDAAPFARGAIIQTEDGSVTYETAEDLIIPSGVLTGTVLAVEGRTVDESATGIAALDAPGGQRVTLGNTPFIEDSERVFVAGLAWTRVDNFLNSGAFSRHYVVELDASDRPTVVFGDGVNGERPSLGASIAIRYRVGGGTRGSVKRGRLTRLVGSFYTLGGVPVDVSVTNPADSSPGSDRETLAHAKIAAPLALRATTRTVAREDFELHAMEVPGVARALCHTRNEDALIPFLQHRVYIVPTDAGTPSGALIDAVVEYLTVTKPRGALDDLDVRGAVYKPYTIGLVVVVFQGVDAAAVLTEATARVNAFFDPMARVTNLTFDAAGNAVDEQRYTLEFGRPLRKSDLTARLKSIPGVEDVQVNAPVSDDVLVPPYGTIATKEFPRLAGAPSITVVTRP